MRKLIAGGALALFTGLAMTAGGQQPYAGSWESTPLGKSTLLNVLTRTDIGRSECPPGKFAVGLEIRSGTLVDGMRLECAKLGPNGEHQNLSQAAMVGNVTGGNARVVRCPSGQVITAVRGRAGEVIDQVRFACRKWNASQGLHGPLNWLAAHGGTGGEPFGPVECPDGMATMTLRAAVSASYIAIFWLACDKLPPIQTAQGTPGGTGGASGSGSPGSSSAGGSTSASTAPGITPPATTRLAQPAVPALTRLSSRQLAGGSVELTIEGDRFSAGEITRVEIGGTAVTYRVVSPDRVVATVPQHVWTKIDPQNVPIVITSGGTRISRQLSVR